MPAQVQVLERDELSGRNIVVVPHSVRAHGQFDSKERSRYTRCHRIGPLPGGIISGMGRVFAGIRKVIGTSA